MTPQNAPVPPSGQTRLHRSRGQRVLFGVCGGIAEYLGIDPTIVRVAFVVVALIPAVNALSIIGYPLLAFILPSEDVAHLPGRDQVLGNLAALRDDADDLVGEVRH